MCFSNLNLCKRLVLNNILNACNLLLNFIVLICKCMHKIVCIDFVLFYAAAAGEALPEIQIYGQD